MKLGSFYIRNGLGCLILCIGVACFVSGCCSVRDFGPNISHFDSAAPYRLLLGRGSGWEGLDTIEIRNDGFFIAYRRSSPGQTSGSPWEIAKGRLPEQSIDKISRLVFGKKFFRLRNKYETDARDGVQWVVLLQQGSDRFCVYCNNQFPPAVRRLAIQIDKELTDVFAGSLVFSPVPGSEGRGHEKELWDCVK